MQFEDIWSEVVTHPDSFILSNPLQASYDSNYFPLSPVNEDDFEVIPTETSFGTEKTVENILQEIERYSENLSMSFISSPLTDSDSDSWIFASQTDEEGNSGAEQELTLTLFDTQIVDASSLPESPASSPFIESRPEVPTPIVVTLDKTIPLLPPGITVIDCDDDDDVVELSGTCLAKSQDLPLPESFKEISRNISSSTKTKTVKSRKRSSPVQSAPPSTKKSKTKITTKTKRKSKKTPVIYESDSDSDLEMDLFGDDEVPKRSSLKKKGRTKKEDTKVTIYGGQPKNFPQEYIAQVFRSEQKIKIKSRNDEEDEDEDVDIL